MKYFLLLIIAIILFLFFAPFGIITNIIMLLIVDNREQYIKLSDYFYAIAYSIDLLGNVVIGDLFNLIMIKHSSSHNFGIKGETISSVLGKNKLNDTLSKSGCYLANLLDKIDSNHCINSIQDI